jgi:hypothetical protein
MIFYRTNINTICIISLAIPLLIVACMLYAYIVNASRPADDPEKKDYELGAILIAPFTFPFLIALGIIVFILRAILFAIYLVALITVLLFFRKPFLIAWLQNVALRIGDPLLKINTQLFRLAWAQWKPEPA